MTTVGARAQWTPTRRLTLRVAAFDGASGDPGGPGRFLDVTFSGRSGAMMIGEADLALASGVRVAVGGWGYTGRYPLLAAPAASREGQAGVYGFVEGPLPGLSGWRAWVRAGRADPGVDVVAGYLGGGVVRTAPFAGRPDDQLGFAVARALIAADAQRVRGLPDAETTLEASYALQARPWLVVQPDLQYVIHPAGAPAIPSALAIGLRFAVIGVRTEVATHEGF
ncbi:MAG: carbohydrate porin [Caulobacteraceae bacterium]